MKNPVRRAVWSFWTKPFRADRQSYWFSEKHHLLSWILSFERARLYYPETILITDDDGAGMLVDGLGLEFKTVSTELNALQLHNPEWWVLGKLYAYRMQTQPFVHIDSDVFLWKPLPDQIVSASVFAQNPEYFTFGDDHSCYKPEVYMSTLESVNGWLPDELKWSVSTQYNEAMCCGILGGQHVDLIRHYAYSAIKMLEHPNNQNAFSLLEQKPFHSIMVEQYFVAACVAYHQYQVTSAYHDITTAFLFDSFDAAFKHSKQVGFTHLLGGAKKNPQLAQKLEARVATDYPERYQRCLQYLEKADTVTSTLVLQ